MIPNTWKTLRQKTVWNIILMEDCHGIRSGGPRLKIVFFLSWLDLQQRCGSDEVDFKSLYKHLRYSSVLLVYIYTSNINSICIYIYLHYHYFHIFFVYKLSSPSAHFVSAKVLDLFDEALEPSLRVAFDGTDSTPSLDARTLSLKRQFVLCSFLENISIYWKKVHGIFLVISV